MSPQQCIGIVLLVVWGAVWCIEYIIANRRRKRAEDLLAESAARLSLHYANPIDADVCDRVLQHFRVRP
jgi:hypothetical protein